MNRSRSTKKRHLTDEQRELARERALIQGAERAAEVTRKVRLAIKSINDEMSSNEGIYPQNGGAVNAAELCRRAGINQTTLYGPAYSNEKENCLFKEVTAWLTGLKQEAIVDRTQVRLTLRERLEAWRKQYHDLLQSHRISELQLQEMQSKFEDSEARATRLEAEVARLERELTKATSSRVVPLASRRQTKNDQEP